MIISHVSITNFRCYYGQNDIDLNTSGKITLIYGDSGYGKSTLLQFFRWIFYGDVDFGVKESANKPLFNQKAFLEAKPGNNLIVEGKVDFEHLSVRYCLTKRITFQVSLTAGLTKAVKTEYFLQTWGMKGDGETGWTTFDGDVPNKINSILPQGLSKYFLLDGERARDIVLNPGDLKKAIYSLFGLDAYQEAISHIGNVRKKHSVLGYYENERLRRMPATIAQGKSVIDLQSDLEDLNDLIERAKEDREKIVAKIKELTARRDIVLTNLGNVRGGDTVKKLIQANKARIDQLSSQIVVYQQQIGNLFYKHYPYLFLSRVAESTARILREKNAELMSNITVVFEHLKKELLKEILSKGICVCGREVDEETHSRLSSIIAAMPPDSYTYQFRQFVNKAKGQVEHSRSELHDYDTIIGRILDCESQIDALENQNREYLAELEQLKDSQELVQELRFLDNELNRFNVEKQKIDASITKKRQLAQIAERQLATLIEKARVSDEYASKIKFFTQLAELLLNERKQKEAEIRRVLNRCVQSVFKQLTTQTTLNADEIEFVKTDFSLRSTSSYLSGGQLAVDEYSYVIGIVKALQECKMERNETPLIIDAPFAFTGNTQSEHIFRTLPSILRQTILLTLDLNKIKNMLDDTSLYELYIIENATQDCATIRRGDLNDINL